MRKLILSMIFVLLVFNSMDWGQSGFTQKDRELLIELKTVLRGIDKRFEQIDKRFEQVERRIVEVRQDMNKRFEQVGDRIGDLRQDMNSRFGQIMNTIWILAAIFTAITVGTISFALWDRRTMIRPFETKVAELDNKIENNTQINEKLLGR